ncbi:MAG: ACP S-malonyltransferase [Parachlamydiaceae bacterium]|nr:ACP S-malonyltransferase [Parachlamydiaceae bacterium]
MQSSIAFIFPGQGSQYPGMAKDFVSTFAIARHTLEEADDLLGRKLSTLILEGPENILTETKNSQVGIFVASMAILRVLKDLYPHINSGVCAGLSLGEYTALCASGKLDFKETLSLVKYRGQFMNDACEEIPGTMAVVLGLEGPDVEALVREVNLPHDLWVANFNCPGQVVISGTLKGIEIGSAAAKAKGAKRVLPLQVHGAFHSGLMATAEKRLREPVEATKLNKSLTEFVMNVPGDFVEEMDVIKENLIKQVTHSVRWEQGIRTMEKRGVSKFIEIGCGKTLAALNKRIGVKAVTLSIEKVEDLQAIEQLQEN